MQSKKSCFNTLLSFRGSSLWDSGELKNITFVSVFGRGAFMSRGSFVFMKGLFSLFLFVFLVGCGTEIDFTAKEKVKDQKQKVEQAVKNLQSGKVLEEIAQKQKTDSAEKISLPKKSTHENDEERLSFNPSAQPEFTLTLSSDLENPVQDSCWEMGYRLDSFVDSPNEEFANNNLIKMSNCFRELFKPFLTFSQAFAHYRDFKLSNGVLFSAMTEAEVKEYLLKNDLFYVVTADLPAEKKASVRGSYSNDELKELVELLDRRRFELSSAEKKIAVFVNKNRKWVEFFATKSNRYKVLLDLVDNPAEEDTTGFYLSAALEKTLDGKVYAFLQNELKFYPYKLLHPFVLVAVIPDKGKELAPLDAAMENPFITAYQEFVFLNQGDVTQVAQVVETYKKIRDMDNPQLPAPLTVSEDDSVGLAFLDTGVDFQSYPELGVFLGDGSKGHLQSYDYTDHDSNPWAPAAMDLGHGSGTMATALTVLSHHMPEVLLSNKFSVAMWKIGSVRSFLTGYPYQLGQLWTGRGIPVFEAVVQHVEGKMKKPDVLSVSLSFKTEVILQAIKRPDLLMKTPWLWVMAAGNSSHSLDKFQDACLTDVPVDRRPSNRIICVGALKKGILGDVVASYSNFGKDVDVYSYETYNHYQCPSGTSCSTPAVAAAATALKAKFPALTPEQVKQAIVRASVEVTLPIEGVNVSNPQIALFVEAGLIEKERKVKFFDPERMMTRAFEAAKDLL